MDIERPSGIIAVSMDKYLGSYMIYIQLYYF